MNKTLIILFALGFFVTINAQNNNNNDDDDNKKPYLNLWVLIQNDVIYDIKSMDPDWVGGFRPSKIPVYNTDPGWGSYGNLYYSVRPSTFKFEGVIPVKHKWDEVRLRFEFDLFGMGPNAGETAFRFRLAYGDWGPIRVGKDWSTFVDLDAFPNNYEWWGPSGMALLPAPTIRYTQKLSENSSLEIALEIPGNEIDPGKIRIIDPELINIEPKEIIPDFITRFSHRGNFGFFKTAVMLRRLEYHVISIEHDKTKSESEFGWAVNLTSGINTFKKKGILKLQTVFGQGYASYNNDGGVELAPNANLRAEVPFQYGFAAFYDYNISERWETSFGYSETVFDNSEGQLYDSFHRSQYAIGQLIYNLIPGTLITGINFQYGKKYNKDGNSASDQRVLFNVTYKFSMVR